MTAQHDLDRILDAWFHGDASAAPPPEPLARVIQSSRAVRPRSAALAWIGSDWVDADDADGVRGAIAGLRPAVVVALALLLALALTGGALLVGGRLVSQPPVPSPFGLYRNGAIAVARGGDIFVADRPGGELRPLVTGPGNDGSPHFSPDGTKLAFVRRDDPEILMIADADGTDAVQLPMPDFESTSGWTFAPDSRSLMAVAVVRGAKRVVLRSIEPAGSFTVVDLRLPDSWQDIEVPRFRPTDPQELLVVAQPERDPGGSDARRGLYLYNLATGGLREIVAPADDRYVHDVAWLPDGEHIIYSLSGDVYLVAADGSGARPIDGWRDRISPVSNDGTRFVVDLATVDVPGDDSHQGSAVVPIDGDGEPVELACGLGTELECAWSWIWSPDDSTLIGTVPHWTSGEREASLPDTYLQADPVTGRVTELDWVDVGTLDWQRLAP